MRVVLVMRGGDSSASAELVVQQGHEVIGLFMRSGVADLHRRCAISQKCNEPYLEALDPVESPTTPKPSPLAALT